MSTPPHVPGYAELGDINCVLGALELGHLADPETFNLALFAKGKFTMGVDQSSGGPHQSGDVTSGDDFSYTE